MKGLGPIFSTQDLTVGQLKKILAELPDNMGVSVMDLTQHDWPFGVHRIYVGVLEHGHMSDVPGKNELILELL